MKRILSISFFAILVTAGCGPMPVSETRAPADIAAVQKAEIPLVQDVPGAEASLDKNVYVIFDGSGSMGDNCGSDERFRNKLEGGKWALGEFLKKVPEKTNLGLYVFDYSGEREIVPLSSNNRAQFVAAVNAISAGGGTPLAEGMRFGTERLVKQYQKQLGYGGFRLVVVTDGEADGIPDAALHAAKYSIPIYSIGLCVGADHPLRAYSFSYKAADNIQELAKGLEETLAESNVFDATEFGQTSKQTSGPQ